MTNKKQYLIFKMHQGSKTSVKTTVYIQKLVAAAAHLAGELFLPVADFCFLSLIINHSSINLVLFLESCTVCFWKVPIIHKQSTQPNVEGSQARSPVEAQQGATPLVVIVHL